MWLRWLRRWLSFARKSGSVWLPRRTRRPMRVEALEDRLAPARFDGGVSVALGDFNGDGVSDLVSALGSGGNPLVHVTARDGSAEIVDFAPYGMAFRGGVSVATGDVNGDGVVDLVTGAGPGGGPHVRVVSGATGDDLANFFAYDPAFTGGVVVASADVDGDGSADVVAGAGAGGGPHVKVWSGRTGREIASFMAFVPDYRGGVSVAAADLDGDGRADVVVGAGVGTAPVVKVFGGESFAELASFLAYSPAFLGGVHVAVGDVTGDGRPDIVTGAGAGGGPHVQVFGGPRFESLDSFFAYGPGFTGGAWVAAGDVNGDGRAEIVTGAGPGGGPHVEAWNPVDHSLVMNAMAFGPDFGFQPAQAVPGASGTDTTVQLRFEGGDTTYRGEYGVYRVDGPDGRVGGLAPGAPGYAAAALADGRRTRVVDAAGASPPNSSVVLPAGSHFGFYQIQNRSYDSWQAAPTTPAYFSLPQANADRYDHSFRLPGGKVMFEDLTGGGDEDFNDFVASFRFRLADGSVVDPVVPPVTSPTLPPGVPPTTPPVTLPTVPPGLPPTSPPVSPPASPPGVPPTTPPVAPPASPPPPPPVPSDLSHWTVEERGGRAGLRGGVAFDSGLATLLEGDSFTVTLSKSFVVAAGSGPVVFTVSPPAFDATSAGSIRDALEVALLDDRGRPLTGTIAGGRDSLFNRTEGDAAPLAAAGVTISGDAVSVDLSALAVGTTATLVLRLVNNDRDTGGTVAIRSVFLPAGSAAAEAPVKFFVVDPAADRAFRYGEEGLSADSFALAATDARSSGVASNRAGDTVWVVDRTTKRVGVYSAAGSELGGWTAADAVSPEGVSVSDGDLWLADAGANRVRRYTAGAGRRGGAAAEDGGFALDAANGAPSDLVTDGATVWVTDAAAASVFVYDTAGTLLGRWKLDGDNAAPSGITRSPAGGADLWVVDRARKAVFQYPTGADARSGQLTAAGTFRLDPSNTAPEGIADPPPAPNLALSDAGLARGFSLTTFATDFNGPGGIVFPASGGVLVTAGGDVWRLPDGTDGQSVLGGVPASSLGGGNVGGMTILDGVVYMTSPGRGQLLRLADDGTVAGSIVADLPGWILDVKPNPVPDVNGHRRLLVSGTSGILDVDPLDGTFTSVADGFFDGLTVGGTVVYGANVSRSAVLGYDVRTHDLVFDSGPIPGGVDGAALGGGNLSGYLYANTNSAGVWEINLATKEQVQIAGGPTATRGDFVSVAPDGSLLLTQSGEIDRLIPPAGGGFGKYEVSISVSSPATRVAADSTAMLTGLASSVRDSDGAAELIVAVSVNGTPVDALDAAGGFFAAVAVPVGESAFTFTALSASGRSASTTITLTGETAPAGRINFAQFADLTATFRAEYARTSFRAADKTLYTDIAVRNLGQYPAGVPLLVGVKNLSDPAVKVRNAAGTLPDGTPYYDFTGLVTGGAAQLMPDAATGTLSLVFSNPNRGRFTYDLVFLGVPNRAPSFTTIPELEASPGRAYIYDANATDPDGDTPSFTVLSGPVGMTIDAATGVLTWTPTAAQLGNFPVSVQVSDGRGGSATQSFTVVSVANRPNRPPVFTSAAVVDVELGTTYRYDANAADPDADPLTFALGAGAPAGMTIDAATGVIVWTPAASQLGHAAVTVSVTDGRGGTAAQAFEVCVTAGANRPPVIVSDPVTTVRLASQATPGRIFLAHDVNTTSSSAAAQETQFVVGVANWLIGRATGKILVVESSPGDGTRDFAADVRSALTTAGYQLTVTAENQQSLSDLRQYDAVFVGERYPAVSVNDTSVLTAYVRAGGNVYLYGGVGPDADLEARSWRPFLSEFGLALDTTYNTLGGNVPITSSHPALAGITSLLAGVGSSVLDLEPSNPANQVIASYAGYGLFAVYDPTVRTGTGVSPVSGPVVNPANGHTYYLLESASWTASEAAAVALGGHLATVRSQAENDWIYSQFTSAQVPRGLWIGLNDAGIEGTYTWTSGEAAAFRNWGAGEPRNQTGTDDYVHLLWPGDPRAAQWNDQFDASAPQGIPISGVVEVTGMPLSAIYRYDVDALDPDGGATTYTLTQNPSGMTIDAATGVISWTPAAAGLTFADDFEGAASPQWGNENGAWAAASGTYAATQPNNNPITYNTLPFDVADFTLQVDVVNPDDGGIWLRSPRYGDGVLLVLTRDGEMYWHTLTNGEPDRRTEAIQNRVFGVFTRGEGTLHVRVVVRGDTYEAFIGNETTPRTTLTTASFSHGRVGLYQLGGQHFDNFRLTTPGLTGQSFPVTVRADDGRGGSDEQHFTVTVIGDAGPRQFDPVVEWHKDTFAVRPDSNQVMMTPAVIDVNGDHIPDVVFSTFGDSYVFGGSAGGVLRAVSGSDGREIWAATDPAFAVDAYSGVAVGDVDRDGRPEIFAADPNQAIAAFRSDGTGWWKSPPIPGGIGWGSGALADLDGDGVPELVVGSTVLNTSDGTIRWTGSRGTGNGGNGPLSIVADLDRDGSPEVVTGNTAYHSDGSIYWSLPAGDGFPAVGNFDADPYPEIVVVGGGVVSLFEHDGTRVWGPVANPGGFGGAPTIADFDNDGQPEIGVAGQRAYTVFETDGTVKWSMPAADGSAVTGSSVFDFDGDGAAEVVYADELFLRIYRGTDGTVLYSLPKSSGTTYEYPVIADVDGDGNAEIVAVANRLIGGAQTGLYVIGDRNNTWVNARQIWNQHTYHITNVNDDGTIPAHEANSWETYNTYRLNVLTSGFDPRSAPDLLPTGVAQSVGANGNVTFIATVRNDGSPVSPGVSVAFYDGNPAKGGRLLGTVPTATRLTQGQSEAVSFTVPAGSVNDLWVRADDDGAGIGVVPEFDETNNALRARIDLDPTNFAPKVTRPFTAAETTATARTAFRLALPVLDPDGDEITFAVVAGPDGLIVHPSLGIVAWVPARDQVGTQQVVVRATDYLGNVTVVPFAITVNAPPLTSIEPLPPLPPLPPVPTSVSANTAPVVISTPPALAVVGSVYAYNLVARDADGGPIRWSLVSGPQGMALDADHGAIRWQPADDQTGPVTVTVRATDALLATGDQTFTIDVSCANQPPAITSRPPTLAYVSNPYLYAVRAVDPESGPLTFTLDSAPAGMAFVPGTSLIRWTPTPPQAGPQAVVIRVTDQAGNSATQAFALEVSTDQPNRPPVITSRPTLLATLGREYRYAVIARDTDGDPLSFALTNPPAGMTIDAQGRITWTPTAAGNPTITVEVTDGRGGIAVQSFVLTVRANQAPELSPVADGTVAIGGTFRAAARATDPDGDGVAFALPQAPTGMTIDAQGRITWNPTGGPRTETVTVSATDLGGLSTTTTFTVNVVTDAEAPRVQLVFSGNVVDLGSSVVFQVLATDNIGVAARTLAVNGGAVALDANGRAVWTGAAAGLFTATATASDAAGNVGTASVQVRVLDPNDTAAPDVRFTRLVQDLHTGPADVDISPGTATITYLADLYGTITEPNHRLETWKVFIARAGDVDTNYLDDTDPDYRVIGSGTAEVTNGKLATIDPTVLSNDGYVVLIAAYNANGRGTLRAIQVNVQGEAKLGRLALSFTDLQVPLAGFPIQVVRNYDSFEADKSGNFGFGWSLGVQDAQIRETVPAGQDFVAGRTRVYLTAPDGRRVGFTYREQVLYGSLFGVVVRPHFEADPGINLTLRVDDTQLGRGALFGAFGGVYNPDVYTLATPDGTMYRYDQTAGLRTITDRTGNVLTFTRDGITHSGGESVRFRRDGAGRITEVVDTNGQSIRYRYGAAGELVGVTDQAGVATTYTYRAAPRHFLDTIVDSFGKTVFKAEFDAAGRLVGSIDGTGARVAQNFDVPNNTGTITDARGNVTLLTYDDNGNVLTKTDPEGGVTRYHYADPNNPYKETLVTDPRGNSTKYRYDKLGNTVAVSTPASTTVYAYGPYGQVEAVYTGLDQDPGEGYADSVVAFFDSGTGPLPGPYGGSPTGYPVPVQASVVLGKPGADGLLDFVTLPTGSSITLGFTEETINDRSGVDFFVQTVPETAGEHADVYVSRNGIDFAFVTTVLQGGRIGVDVATAAIRDGIKYVRIVGKDLGGGSPGFDLMGVEAVIGNSPVTASFRYDVSGHVVEAIDAAGNKTTATYDSFGRIATRTDRAGNTTSYDYENGCPCGIPGAVTNPDGSVRRYEHNDFGQITAETDELGNTTRYDFDAVGRLLKTTAPNGQTLTNTYAGRRLVAQTDGLGRATRYEYDDADRVTKQTNPDGGVILFAYDAAGNRTSLTDPVGNVTRWEYDKNNRMVRETDPLGNARTFRYDVAGNKIEGMDRDGRETVWAYDATNRLTAETWFVGPTAVYAATYTFDVVGNLLTEQDNFSRYTYTYDSLDRVVTEDNAGSPGMPRVAFSYGYDLNGNRIRVVDNAGVEVDSVYDSMNRLVRRDWQGGGIDSARLDFGYNAAGQRTGVNRFADLAGTNKIGSSAYGFDASGRIANIVHSGPQGQTLADYRYTFDIADQLTRWSHHGDTADYGYDLTGQLIRADHSVLPDEFFTYDRNGNRASSSLHGSGYVTGPGNQLLSDGTFRYTYDREGNQRTKTEIATGTVTTYDYDHHNRLVHVVEQSSGGIVLNESSYTYDVRGRRIGITTNGQTIHTAYLGDNAWADYSAGGAVAARYLFGDRIDENLARWLPAAGTAWYLTDHLGTVRDLVNAVGAVVDHIDYGGFGNILSQANAGVGDRYGFTGRDEDAATGDNFLRYRYYDPRVGRFTTEDPLRFAAGATNLVGYVQNNPISNSDPRGLLLESALLRSIVVGAIAGASSSGGGAPTLKGAVIGAVIGGLVGVVGGAIGLAAGAGSTILSNVGAQVATCQLRSGGQGCGFNELSLVAALAFLYPGVNATGPIKVLAAVLLGQIKVDTALDTLLDGVNRQIAANHP